jgi:ribosome-associated heat shock protein Hsp15
MAASVCRAKAKTGHLCPDDLLRVTVSPLVRLAVAPLRDWQPCWDAMTSGVRKAVDRTEQPARSPILAHQASLRIDKYLWYVRLARSRSVAQALAERGVVRVNGRRIERAHSPVRVGDLITLPVADQVRVVRVLSLPDRRGAASIAVTCYDQLELGVGAT